MKISQNDVDNPNECRYNGHMKTNTQKFDKWTHRRIRLYAYHAVQTALESGLVDDDYPDFRDRLAVRLIDNFGITDARAVIYAENALEGK